MPVKPKFDARKLMELAIEVMRQSVHEPRQDGKPSPIVGTVLYKPDGTIETSCRGELRHGDHAEYTLLERKNRSSKLDGAMLFTTLEPCAPGSRRHPKLSCAERIVSARMAEAWIGIEDPDPTVDRKGIKFLQDSGIKVHMFDRDLQEVIQEENRQFIDQALERAAAEKRKKPKTVTLSKLEHPISAAAMDDFAMDALERYRTIARIDDAIDSEPFQRRLMQQGLLKEVEGKRSPTGFGLLLFGREPRTVMPQAGLLGTMHYLDGTEETRDFDGAIVLIPGLVEQWLQDKLPSTIDRSRMQRKKSPVLPFELVREAVVNALVHRDYEIAGAKCQLVVLQDTITVRSPGGPLAPVTLENLQSFNAPMLSRNPQLHYVFARMDLAEERGLGMKTFRAIPEKYGLPLPRYAFEDPYLELTLFRSPEAAVSELRGEILEALSKAERAGWEWLATKQTVTSGEYAAAMRIPNRTALNHLKHFTELGLVRKLGSGPATRYDVVRQ